VLFGGRVTNSSSTAYLQDTWEWDGTAWTQRVIAGPSVREDHAMAYDSGRHVIVLFGGLGPNFTDLSDTWELGGGAAPCYANCDQSTTPPVLNVLDFSCFLNKFAAGDTYANCDGSTTVPVLNVLDFSCFLNRFAAGCS
jgi:hypothetical protein